jgi:hypothetical protein
VLPHPVVSRRCADCQVPVGFPCVGELVPHLCRLIEYRDAFPKVADGTFGVESEPLPAPAHYDPEQLRLAETCPFRAIPECGCSGMACAPGGRREGRFVTILDCYHCIGPLVEGSQLAPS